MTSHHTAFPPLTHPIVTNARLCAPLVRLMLPVVPEAQDALTASLLWNLECYNWGEGRHGA